MPDYFIYSRKSSEAEDRQVLSIESQITELTRLAEARGLRVCEILTEARSAKEPGRAVFDGLMQRVCRGEARGIICWKLDRLARNPIDGGAVIWAMKQHGLEIITPHQTFRQSDDTTMLSYIDSAWPRNTSTTSAGMSNEVCVPKRKKGGVRRLPRSGT